ncbi:MAG: hypothetical protein ACR2IK_18005 [Chloroflexota bacterium]
MQLTTLCMSMPPAAHTNHTPRVVLSPTWQGGLGTVDAFAGSLFLKVGPPDSSDLTHADIGI